eukprot:symbB.v1.2.026333.t1/scaffold2623.1/size98372/5
MFQDQNPKKGGSNAWGRYEKYKKCTSIGEATAAGANWQDLSSDFEKGYMKFSIPEDVEMPASTKRAAIEGTPDKEAEQRSRVSPSQVAPFVLAPPAAEAVNKVEMSGATIAALRRMMREEVKLGVEDMEQKVAARLDQSLGPLQEHLCEEKGARQKLEERVRLLEDKISNNVAKREPDDEVDKSVVVLGGFGEKEPEEAQDLVNRVTAEVDGFKDVHFTNNVMVRQGGKLCPVAMVGEDMDVQWSNNGVPAVREALDAFIAELE